MYDIKLPTSESFGVSWNSSPALQLAYTSGLTIFSESNPAFYSDPNASLHIMGGATIEKDLYISGISYANISEVQTLLTTGQLFVAGASHFGTGFTSSSDSIIEGKVFADAGLFQNGLTASSGVQLAGGFTSNSDSLINGMIFADAGLFQNGLTASSGVQLVGGFTSASDSLIEGKVIADSGFFNNGITASSALQMEGGFTSNGIAYLGSGLYVDGDAVFNGLTQMQSGFTSGSDSRIENTLVIGQTMYAFQYGTPAVPGRPAIPPKYMYTYPGYLEVQGTSMVIGNLNISKTFLSGSEANVVDSASGQLNVEGASLLQSGFTSNDSSRIVGNLMVDSESDFLGGFTSNSSSRITADVVIENNLQVASESNFIGGFTANGESLIEGGLTLTGGLNAYWMNDRLTAGSTALYMQNGTFRTYINGANRFTIDTTGNANITSSMTVGSNVRIGNSIDLGSGNYAAPQVSNSTGGWSLGTKINLWGGPGYNQYAMGVEVGNTWISGGGGIKLYTGADAAAVGNNSAQTAAMTITGTGGMVTIKGGLTVGGTAQIVGGLNISGWVSGTCATNITYNIVQVVQSGSNNIANYTIDANFVRFTAYTAWSAITTSSSSDTDPTNFTIAFPSTYLPNITSTSNQMCFIVHDASGVNASATGIMSMTASYASYDNTNRRALFPLTLTRPNFGGTATVNRVNLSSSGGYMRVSGFFRFK